MHKTIKRLTMQEGRYRFSVLHLLIAIVVMFVVSPFADRLTYGRFVESVIFTIFLLAAMNAVGGRRSILVAAAVLVFPVLITRWCNHFWPNLIPIDLNLVAAIVFVSFVIVHLFRFVITAPRVNSEVICAGICIYLLFAVAWAFIYTLLSRWQPNAFEFSNSTEGDAGLAGFTAMYFSVQILTTITFGDILPATNVARMLALV